MTEQVQAPATTEVPVVKKARKERSDKGQKRGPRKPKAATTEG